MFQYFPSGYTIEARNPIVLVKSLLFASVTVVQLILIKIICCVIYIFYGISLVR